MRKKEEKTHTTSRENMNRRRRESGLSLMGMLVLIPILLIAGAIGWYVFCEARKAYWDDQVNKMCEKDGGVKIYEYIAITQEQEETLGQVAGYLSVSPKNLANPKAPVFSEISESVLRDKNPRVSRWEERVLRRIDNKQIASIVRYRRAGGDFPSPAEQSYYSCPQELLVFESVEKFFKLNREK